MFVDKFSGEELAKEMEDNLKKIASIPEKQTQDRISNIMELLRVSANLLDEVGLDKQAFIITHLMSKTAEDAATKGLTSEKMLKNLETKGWVFNVDDQDVQDSIEFLRGNKANVTEVPNEIVIEDGENIWDSRYKD